MMVTVEMQKDQEKNQGLVSSGELSWKKRDVLQGGGVGGDTGQGGGW